MTESVVPDAPETARLRARNQITIPERVVSRLHAKPGDRFVLLVEGRDSVRLVRVRESYARALPGLWGPTQRDGDEWLREERGTWRRRQELYDAEGSVGSG